MGLVGSEAVVGAIVTKLKTDLPAKITALNAEYADAYALADVAAGSYYSRIVNPLALKCDWPAICVFDDSDVEDGEQSNFALHVVEYGVVVDIIARGQDGEELTRKLWRYKRAVREILTARHSLAPTCTNCTYDRGGGVALTDRDSGDLLQDKALRFIVTTAEAAP